MNALSFEERGVVVGGKRVRCMTFERRSTLPVSAACVVANGIRETLASLWETPVSMRLFTPTVPSSKAWKTIAEGARLFRVGGTLTDAVLVVRPVDAAALAAVAFREPARGARSISAIEHTVVERTIRALTGTLAPVCGLHGDLPPFDEIDELAAYTTYVEVQIDRPAAIRMGIALARDPAPGGVSLSPGHILGVEVELAVHLGGAFIPASMLAGLEVGAIVPMTQGVGCAATLMLAGSALAGGECGVRNGRFAMTTTTMHHEGSREERR